MNGVSYVGPWGGGGGGTADFQFFVEDRVTEEIIGFFGRAHTYIDAIGFVVRKRE
jgi:hypothetical protein